VTLCNRTRPGNVQDVVTECNRAWQTLVVGATEQVPDAGERLTADERREALLDVTRVLVLEQGPRAITMGSVADRATVTRALLYKHFANKDDLLAALYHREASRLDRAMRRIIAEADDTFEGKLRAFVTGALAASEEHSVFFAPLRSIGAQPDARRDRRTRDRRTVKYFAELAVADFGVDERTARSIVAVLLSGIDNLLLQLHSHPGAEQRAFLGDVYVKGAIGALERLAAT
jgi:AcrR family transcriptional regulator